MGFKPLPTLAKNFQVKIEWFCVYGEGSELLYALNERVYGDDLRRVKISLGVYPVSYLPTLLPALRPPMNGEAFALFNFFFLFIFKLVKVAKHEEA